MTSQKYKKLQGRVKKLEEQRTALKSELAEARAAKNNSFERARRTRVTRNAARDALDLKARQEEIQKEIDRKNAEKLAKDLARLAVKAQEQKLDLTVVVNGKEARIEVDTPRKGIMGLVRKFGRAVNSVTKFSSSTGGAILLTGAVAAVSIGQSTIDAQAGHDPQTGRNAGAPHELVLTAEDRALAREMQSEALNARFGAVVGPIINRAVNTAVDEIRSDDPSKPAPVRQATVTAPKSTVGAP